MVSLHIQNVLFHCSPFSLSLSADILIERTKTHHSTHKHVQIHASTVCIVIMMVMVMVTHESNSTFFFQLKCSHTLSFGILVVPYGWGHIAHQLLFALLSVAVYACVCVSFLLALVPSSIYNVHMYCVRFSLLNLSRIAAAAVPMSVHI